MEAQHSARRPRLQRRRKNLNGHLDVAGFFGGWIGAGGGPNAMRRSVLVGLKTGLVLVALLMIVAGLGVLYFLPDVSDFRLSGDIGLSSRNLPIGLLICGSAFALIWIASRFRQSGEDNGLHRRVDDLEKSVTLLFGTKKEIAPPQVSGENEIRPISFLGAGLGSHYTT